MRSPDAALHALALQASDSHRHSRRRRRPAAGRPGALACAWAGDRTDGRTRGPAGTRSGSRSARAPPTRTNSAAEPRSRAPRAPAPGSLPRECPSLLGEGGAGVGSGQRDRHAHGHSPVAGSCSSSRTAAHAAATRGAQTRATISASQASSSADTCSSARMLHRSELRSEDGSESRARAATAPHSLLPLDHGCSRGSGTRRRLRKEAQERASDPRLDCRRESLPPAPLSAAQSTRTRPSLSSCAPRSSPRLAAAAAATTAPLTTTTTTTLETPATRTQKTVTRQTRITISCSQEHFASKRSGVRMKRAARHAHHAPWHQ